MPFLLPALPFLMASAPIGLGLAMGGGQSKAGAASSALLQRAQEKGFQIADKSQAAGDPLLRMGQRYLPQAARYYQGILSGSPGAMQAATAAERGLIDQGFNSARSAIMAGPRGGGRTSALFQLPTQQAAANANLLYNVRPQAAQGLLQAGQTALSGGTGLYGAATQGIYGTSGAANSLLNYDLQQQAANQARNNQIGSSIYDLIQKIPTMIGGGGIGGNKVDSSIPVPRAPGSPVYA